MKASLVKSPDRDRIRLPDFEKTVMFAARSWVLQSIDNARPSWAIACGQGLSENADETWDRARRLLRKNEKRYRYDQSAALDCSLSCLRD